MMVTLDDLMASLTEPNKTRPPMINLHQIVQGEIDYERWFVPIQIGETAGIQTRDWKLLRKPDGTLMLFAKPEDFWDANDVALRYPAICDTLVQCLDQIQAGASDYGEPS
jgi:hypothetical protein